MPFKSEAQRRYMHANHPEIAQSWEHKYGSTSTLPRYVGKKKKRKKSGRR